MSDDDKWDSVNFRTDLQSKSGPMGLMSNQWDGEDEEEEVKRKLEELLEKKLREREQMTPEEIHAEKMRQQKLQEEADLEVTKHLLGVDLQSDSSALETKEDFEKYKDEIVRQLGSATKNQNFPGFVEQLVQALCVHLSAAELKKIHTWVGNLQIEKHKMEQGTKTKKKGKGKAKLKLEGDTDIYSSYNEDVYDDFM
ncbi:eukaryotic translation initiation factor 3 subunit j isoform X2 [Lycorma delicatula]|uniref:eukaryotic translation initiation factor 3 subunit j isoform X2 n=1 Tax=Lycorma delicatula TaxID=130591 RepID=UPI003F50E747